MPAAGEQLYSALERAPFGNDLVADFAIRAMTAENLGRGTGIDVLAVSFSSNDYVGHTLGPEAPEVRDITVRTDATLARLLAAIEKQVGLRNTLLVLTSDHGVAPSIRMSELHKIPGGRLRIVDVKKAADDALDARFGAADWVEYAGEFGLWLNSDAMEEKKLDPRLVEEVAARAVAELRDVFRTYTRTQLERSAPRDRVDERVFQGWNSKRSPDIVVVPDPFWIAHPTLMITHGAPFRYDSAVPLVFLSPLVKPGRYHRTAHVTDVAPTIATLLGILPPAGALGRVLDEMLR
jgi:arylsulfatase A-like enzyme